jgi:hypothetical protein
VADVAAVLDRAAQLLEHDDWVPVRPYRPGDRRLTALQGVTSAVDELAGTGPGTADPHQAALDAVCRHVYGCACTTPNRTVGTWNARQARDPIARGRGPMPAQTDQTADEVIRTLRHVAQTASPDRLTARLSASGAADGTAPPGIATGAGSA